MTQNQTILNEFEKLIKFIQLEIDQSKNKKDVKAITSNSFRIKQTKNILAIIKKYPNELTLKNLKEFSFVIVNPTNNNRTANSCFDIAGI